MKKTNKKGFTLIEVVLVLAIGGLIFLLAFLAFRNASTNRRDTARRNDAGKFIAELQNYASDNSTGALPNGQTETDTFVTNYLASGSGFKDPSTGNTYTVKWSNSAPSSVGDVSYGRRYKCDGSSKMKLISNNAINDGAVIVKLEKGFVCRDTQ